MACQIGHTAGQSWDAGPRISMVTEAAYSITVGAEDRRVGQFRLNRNGIAHGA
jgi:hypothetical protein